MPTAGAEVSVGRKGAMLGSLGDGDGGRMFVAGVGASLTPLVGEGVKLKKYGAGTELGLVDVCSCGGLGVFGLALEPVTRPRSRPGRLV